MWNRKRLLNWNTIRLIQTPGSAHQESRAWAKGTWSQTNPGCSAGRRKPETFFQRLGHRASGNQKTSVRCELKLMSDPQGIGIGAWKTLRPGKSARKNGTKGQPEGYAIKSKPGKPRVTKPDRKTCNVTGQNNSNPTPFTASAENGEWELLFANSSHYCFIPACKVNQHPIFIPPTGKSTYINYYFPGKNVCRN